MQLTTESPGIRLCADINTHWLTHSKSINDDTLWDHIIKPAGLEGHLELAHIAKQFQRDHLYSDTMSQSEHLRRLDEFIQSVSSQDYWSAINIKPKRKRHPHKTALWQIITQVDEIIGQNSEPRDVLFREVI